MFLPENFQKGKLPGFRKEGNSSEALKENTSFIHVLYQKKKNQKISKSNTGSNSIGNGFSVVFGGEWETASFTSLLKPGCGSALNTISHTWESLWRAQLFLKPQYQNTGKPKN